MDEESARRRFKAIYDQHRQAILAYSLRRAHEQDAHDIVNETFTIVWRRIDKAPEADAALPWLYSTARGVLSNQRRSRQRYARLISKSRSIRPLPETGPEAQVIRNQELARVAEALGRLRPPDREILLLAIWEELPRADIGAALGISEAAATKRLSRAVDRLTVEVNRTRPHFSRVNPVPRTGGAR